MFDNEMFAVKSPDCQRLWRHAIMFCSCAVHVFNFCPPPSDELAVIVLGKYYFEVETRKVNMFGRINHPGVALDEDFKFLVIVNFDT